MTQFKDGKIVVFSYISQDGYPQTIEMMLLYSQILQTYMFATTTGSNKIKAMQLNNKITFNYGSMIHYKKLQYVHCLAQVLDRNTNEEVYQEQYKNHSIIFKHFFQNVDSPTYTLIKVKIEQICHFNENSLQICEIFDTK